LYGTYDEKPNGVCTVVLFAEVFKLFKGAVEVGCRPVEVAGGYFLPLSLPGFELACSFAWKECLLSAALGMITSCWGGKQCPDGKLCEGSSRSVVTSTPLVFGLFSCV
jgi:hypothetical protein